MTTPRPGSRAEQRRRTEARILDAATQVFFSAGYDRTTIRAVASAAGVDAGLVMHYFGSKQQLYRRAIDAPPAPVIRGGPEHATGPNPAPPAAPPLPPPRADPGPAAPPLTPFCARRAPPARFAHLP